MNFELIPTPQGERLTPSFFSAGGSNNEYLIGKVPKQLYFNNIPQSRKIKNLKNNYIKKLLMKCSLIQKNISIEKLMLRRFALVYLHFIVTKM